MTTLNFNKLLASDIADPSDFPPISSAPGLRDLDSALRCAICSEFFSAPVTLPCGHCFCSYCVRNALSNKQECPNCRKAVNEGHLRLNSAMEDAVTAWKSARSHILELTRDKHISQKPETPRPRLAKRKRSSKYVSTSSEDEAESSRSLFVTPKKQRIAIVESPEVEDSENEADIPTSEPGEQEMTPAKPTDVVSCPMCSRLVRLTNINDHIDSGCAQPTSKSKSSAPSSKSEWSKLFNGNNKACGKERPKGGKSSDIPSDETEPLPKVTYAVLKDKQIREILNENNLPITGDRALWILRHQRWVMLFNANLDRSWSLRQSLSELRFELKRLEEGQKTKKVVVNDTTEYQKAHKSEFAHLIKVARPKKVPEVVIERRTPMAPLLGSQSRRQ